MNDFTQDYGSVLSYWPRGLAVSDEEGGLSLMEIDWTAPLASLADKRITVSYEPARDLDRQMIADAGGSMYDVYPAVYLHLWPRLLVDGKKPEGAHTVDDISMGLPEYLWYELIEPEGGSGGGLSGTIENVIKAGDHVALTIDYQLMPTERVEAFGRELRIAGQSDPPPSDVDELMGRQLALTGHLYFHQIDTQNILLAREMGISLVRKPSVALTQYGMEVSYLFDMAPLEITGSNIHLDLDRDVYAPIPKDGDAAKSRNFTLLSGFYGSLYEEIVLQQLFQAKSTSSLRIIQKAGNEGVPIYMVTANNVDRILPNINLVDPPAGAGEIAASKINAQERAELEGIANAARAGKVILVPQDPVTMEAFAGSAYIITDPKTGSATFMITGGYAGGTITDDIKSFLNEYSTSSGEAWFDFGANNADGSMSISIHSDLVRDGNMDARQVIMMASQQILANYLAMRLFTNMELYVFPNSILACASIADVIRKLLETYEKSFVLYVEIPSSWSSYYQDLNSLSGSGFATFMNFYDYYPALSALGGEKEFTLKVTNLLGGPKEGLEVKHDGPIAFEGGYTLSFAETSSISDNNGSVKFHMVGDQHIYPGIKCDDRSRCKYSDTDNKQSFTHAKFSFFIKGLLTWDRKTDFEVNIRDNRNVTLDDVIHGRAVFIFDPSDSTDPTGAKRSFKSESERETYFEPEYNVPFADKYGVDGVKMMCNQVLSRYGGNMDQYILDYFDWDDKNKKLVQHSRTVTRNKMWPELIEENGIYDANLEQCMVKFKIYFNNYTVSNTTEYFGKDFEPANYQASVMNNGHYTIDFVLIMDNYFSKLSTSEKENKYIYMMNKIIDKETLVGKEFKTNISSDSKTRDGLFELYTNIVLVFNRYYIDLIREYSHGSDVSYYLRNGQKVEPGGGIAYCFGGKQTKKEFNSTVSSCVPPGIDSISIDYRGKLAGQCAQASNTNTRYAGLFGNVDTEYWLWLKDSVSYPQYDPSYWSGIDCSGMVWLALDYAFYNINSLANNSKITSKLLPDKYNCNVDEFARNLNIMASYKYEMWQNQNGQQKLKAEKFRKLIYKGDVLNKIGHIWSVSSKRPYRSGDFYTIIHAWGHEYYQECYANGTGQPPDLRNEKTRLVIEMGDCDFTDNIQNHLDPSILQRPILWRQ